MHAALEAGYSPATARNAGQKIAKHPDVVAAFRRAMKKAGITDDHVAQRIKEGLDAEETKLFQKDGFVTDSRNVVAHGERRQMVELVTRINNLVPRPDVQAQPLQPMIVQIVHVGGLEIAQEAESAIEVEVIGNE